MYMHLASTAEMTRTAVMPLQAVRQHVQLHGRSEGPLPKSELRGQLERWLRDFKRAGIQHNVESLTSLVQVSKQSAAWLSNRGAACQRHTHTCTQALPWPTWVRRQAPPQSQRKTAELDLCNVHAGGL